jgi:hypothetical protein
MTLKDALAQFIATNDLAAPQIELLERVLNPPAERKLADRIPLYPPRNAKRAMATSPTRLQHGSQQRISRRTAR